MPVYSLTKKPLKANVLFEQKALDRMDLINAENFRIYAWSDVVGTLMYEQSNDGITWVRDTFNVPANTFYKSNPLPITHRYFKVKFHTAADQKLFTLLQDINTSQEVPPTTDQPRNFIKFSSDPRPTVSDGVKNEDTLYLVDTKEMFIWYAGQWRDL